MIFRTAILQKRAKNAQIEKNTDDICDAIKTASENKADILLLPECYMTGYDLPMTYEKSISEDCDEIKKICKAAAEYKLGVVLTAFTKGKSRPQNTAFV